MGLKVTLVTRLIEPGFICFGPTVMMLWRIVLSVKPKLLACAESEVFIAVIIESKVTVGGLPHRAAASLAD